MTRHQKRLSTPQAWPVERKTETFTAKVQGGPHGESGVPLIILLRDVLGYVDTTKEARYVLNSGGVVVNGNRVKDENQPIGVFDILAFPKINEYYRVFPDEGGRISLTEIESDAANGKLAKIINKTVVSGGNHQLNLHNGYNIEIEPDDDVYSTNDSIVLDTGSDEILRHFVYKENALATAVAGQHSGEIGRIESIDVTLGSGSNTVRIETEDMFFETIEEYVFVVNREFLNNENKSLSREEDIMPNGSGDNSWKNIKNIIDRLEQNESDSLEEDYQLILDTSKTEDLGPDEIVDIYRVQILLEDTPVDTDDLDEVLDEYFEDMYDPSRVERLQQGIEKPDTIRDVIDNLDRIEKGWETLVEQSRNEPSKDGLEVEKNRYLMAIREYIID